MKYCCFIWCRASQTSLFFAFKPYSSFQADETSIIINYYIFYFHGQSSDELRSLVSPVQTFTARICHAAYILFLFPSYSIGKEEVAVKLFLTESLYFQEQNPDH